MKQVLDFLDLDRLREVYFLANTPFYLFTNFRETSSVQDFAREHKTTELKEFFKTASSAPIASTDELLSVYVLIVCLSFKNITEAKPILDQIDLNIPWGNELKQLTLAHADQLSETTSTINLQVTKREPLRVAVVSSETVVNL